MKISTVLFDLDGTLLPLDQKKFTEECFNQMHKKLAPRGYSMDDLYDCMKAMTSNDGTKTNKQALLARVFEIRGEKFEREQHLFDEFYADNFDIIKNVCGFNSRANEVVKKLKEKGYVVAIATNPLFPRVATEKRIKWAGLDVTDFDLVSTYEEFHYSKPDVRFYEEFVQKLNIKPEECLMVGNDAVEDMIAEKIGMKVFLLTDCLLQDDKVDVSKFSRGDFDKLLEFVDKNL